MKSDVIAWADGRKTSKPPSKETLNHPGIIQLVSGLNVYENTPAAFKAAYEALGIDIINCVPLGNAAAPAPEGVVIDHPGKPYKVSRLGVYDTMNRHTYECSSVEDIWNLDVRALNYSDLVTPVPHPCQGDDIRSREDYIGDTGLYYPMLYTTLFMWGVETLGWETFMIAAFSEPERFHDHFLLPCMEKSIAMVEEISRASDNPFVFLHDDLASATGPVFPPSWYDDYVFPHYKEIFAPAKSRGKKIIFVADGDMTAFLPKLIDVGVDGIQFENPATNPDAVLEHFATKGRFMIGGIDTVRLTNGSPDEVREMVLCIHERMKNIPGFAMSSCGGLHENIPLENLCAYFDARAEIGITPGDWRTRCRLA